MSLATEVASSITRTVLLVEDNRSDLLMVRRMLEDVRRDYEIVTAESGKDALALARARSFDCVLLDFYLPDMRGTEFIDDLAEQEGGGVPLPIVVLTGAEDDSIAVASLQHGAQDYVVKGSITGTGLVRVVENAIEKFHIRRELEEKRSVLELRKWELEMVRDELQSRLSELSHATKAKDQFIAVMSHEMRTPLNAILGYAELLEMQVGGALTDVQQLHVARIRVGGRHLLSLIDDVLDLARADAKPANLDLSPIDVGSVIAEVAALLENQARVKGVALHVDSCATLPLVQADLQRLRQVLMNVIGNAIKFTEQGSIIIRCSSDGDSVRVAVTDTGIGISEDALPLVFDDFYQADGRYKRERGGAGLGLAITQRLIRQIGGDICVDSVVGAGSTFTVSLPIAARTVLP